MSRAFSLAILLATVVASVDIKKLPAAEPAAVPRCPYCGNYHAPGSGHAPGGYYPGASGLPRGRRYYNGRYFGNLNNRFYGPQYGYF